jgi:hypothetical protein
MSARKTPQAAPTPTPPAVPIPRARKKAKGARVRLTHLEVRRGAVLRLRIAVADDALPEIGEELGALIKKISPGARPQTAVVAHESSEIVVSREHSDNDGDYHASVREHLVDLFGSLCDTSLADALEIAREERARRAEGGN